MEHIQSSAQLPYFATENTEAERPFRYLTRFEDISDDEMDKIGGKAARLVEMKKASLPIPDGFCIKDDVHDYYLRHQSLPEGFVDELTSAKRILGGSVALRSSANCEDGTTLSMAGVFKSSYIYDDEDLGENVEDIFLQSLSDEVAEFMSLHGKNVEDVKMGLILQELVDAEVAGVIYTDIHDDSLLIQYVEGMGAKLVDGDTDGSAIIVNSSGQILESTGYERLPLSDHVKAQITDIAVRIKGLYPGEPQDIEFAVGKDEVVYDLQARPLTADLGKVELIETPEDTLEATKLYLYKLVEEEKSELGTQTAIFSDANYSELLPRPTEMDIGIYMYVWGGSDGIPGATQLGRAEMGYRVEDDAIGIIKFIGGRTYFSISRYAGIYHAGFPDNRREYYSTLVNEYLAAIEKDPEKGAYPQMGLILQDPTHEDLRSRFGDRADEYAEVHKQFSMGLQWFADNFIDDFYSIREAQHAIFIEDKQKVQLDSMSTADLHEYIIGILENIRTESYVDFVKAARLGLYYSQRLQDLLMNNLGYSKEDAAMMYSKLNQGLDGSAITDGNIEIAEAATEEKALRLAEHKIGHFNTGEMLEIRHRPLRDEPEAMLRYVRGIRTGDYKNQFEAQKKARLEAQKNLLDSLQGDEHTEFEHAISASQTYMALRETTKYIFTKEYLLVHDALEKLGKKLGLPQGDIYFIYPRELGKLIEDTSSMSHIIRSRKQSFENYQMIDMPHVIRESDIEMVSLVNDEAGEFVEAQGKFLAEGPAVEGVVINIDEFEDHEELSRVIEGYNNVPIILVATQMNLTHDPFIARATSLIIQNAGIVAHGAQRARELGKGALGGIRTRNLKTGMAVSFDPTNKVVRKLESLEKSE